MLIIQNILVSDAVVEEQFHCNLNACRGACCWEGDFGAPLEEEELKIIESIYEKIRPYLSKRSQKLIEQKGTSEYFAEMECRGTPLHDGGACAYMIYDQIGIAHCGIEKAYNNGDIAFRKPISCHLYPLRIKEEKASNFEAINYDNWDICSAACSLGKEKKIPVYQFVKDALVRKYGIAFYEELDAAHKYLKSKER